MGYRKFNKDAYDAFDMSSKLQLVKIIEKNSPYKLNDDLDIERYKDGDVEFIFNNKKVLFENEVRRNFDDIVSIYKTIHIPIRKKDTPANFYIVWKEDLCQFILIDRKTIQKYKNKPIRVKCNNEMNYDEEYVEEFVDIPKSETQWYLVGKEFKLKKLEY
jgi:hypothetical protein